MWIKCIIYISERRRKHLLTSYCVGFGLRRVCPADKIIHQKLWRAKVMRREQLPIWSGVGEGDLVLAQVGAVRKVVPAVRRQKKHENKEEGEGKAGGLSDGSAHLRHSSMREAMPWRLIMLTTQMRLMPQMAGSGVVEQHQARCRSNITFSPSEPSGAGSSITR